MKLILENHKVVSWNSLYSQSHWGKRKMLVDAIHNLIWAECRSQNLRPVRKYPIKIKIIATQKGRLVDASNVNIKIYEDGLKMAWIIKDDSPKYVKSVEAISVKGKSNFVEIEIY